MTIDTPLGAVPHVRPAHLSAEVPTSIQELTRYLPSTSECLELHPLYTDDVSNKDPRITLSAYDATNDYPWSTQVVHLDEDYMVVNKPESVLVNNGVDGQPDIDKVTTGYWKQVHGMDVRYRNCHQIDFTTSGILVLALHRRAAESIGRLFERRQISKSYLAILRGHVISSASGQPVRVTFPIGKDLDSGRVKMKAFTADDELRALAQHEAERQDQIKSDYKRVKELKAQLKATATTLPDGMVNNIAQDRPLAQPAETHIYPMLHTYLSESLPVTLALLKPITGRRHQLRVHSKAIGHPILGDWTYEEEHERETSLGRMWLHAWEIEGEIKGERFHWMTRVPWETDMDRVEDIAIEHR
jgi:23S rRNA-/tRNA-specific pseudouridylate synthase